jgi:hypothetical protein
VPEEKKPEEKPAEKPDVDGASFVIVPQSAAPDAVPREIAAKSLSDLAPDLYQALSDAGSGWVFIRAEGQRCLLSRPIQLFVLKLPNGRTVEIRSAAEPTFTEDGAFQTLQTRVGS